MRKYLGVALAAVMAGVFTVAPVSADPVPISFQLPGWFGFVGDHYFHGPTTSPDFYYDDGTYGFKMGFGANPYLGSWLHADGQDHFMTENGLGYLTGLKFDAGSGHVDGEKITVTLDFKYSYSVAATGPDDSAGAFLSLRGSGGFPSDGFGGSCGAVSMGCGSFTDLVGQFTNTFTLTQQADGSFLTDTFEVDLHVGTIIHGFDDASAYIDPTFSVSAASLAADSRLQGASFFYSPGVTDAAALPEPASWAMLTLGFGAIGAGLRRRTTDRGTANAR